MGKNRVVPLAAVAAFVVLVAGLAVLADRNADDDGLTRLRYSSTDGERNADAATEPARPDIASNTNPEYRIAPGLQKPADTAPAYRIKPATPDDAERIAKPLGVRAVKEFGGAWTGSGPRGQLRVETDTGFWSFGPGMSPDAPVSDKPDSSAGECEPCPPGQICTMECRARRTILGSPGKDEAEVVAREFWREIGVEPRDTRLSVQNGLGHVTFTTTVDGRDVLGPEHTVAVGADKQIHSASGWIGGRAKIGDYPLIDPADAFKRLGRPPRTAPGSPERLPSSADKNGDGVITYEDPAPRGGSVTTHTLQVPTRNVVTLTSVKLVYEFTGTHLLPAYVFEAGQGFRTGSVPAVPDHLLADPGQPEVPAD